MNNRKLIRLKDYDYKQEGMYFVTVCAHEHKNIFGEIMDGKMILKMFGEKAQEEWQEIPKIRKDMNIQLDEFVIMPNHMHGVLMIGKNKYNSCRDTMPRVLCNDCVCDDEMINKKDAMHCVPTNQFGVQRKNLSSIIRGYKSAVTVYARKNEIKFKWQSRYYEHIIRDENDLNRIREYIINNPAKWEEDKYYKS